MAHNCFPEPLEIRWLDDFTHKRRRFYTLRDFPFVWPDGSVFWTPKGAIGDGASIPLPLWWLESPYGKLLYESVPHDFAYASGLLPRTKADDILRIGMESQGVIPKWKRPLIYQGVRRLGAGGYMRADEHPSAMALVASRPDLFPAAQAV